MPKQPHISALNEQMKLGGASRYRSNVADPPSARTNAAPNSHQNESAAADGPRNDAEFKNEVYQLPNQDTALIATRHPILAMHWGALV